MIKIENINKTYYQDPVLKIAQLQIAAGESIGLTGNNGAGKTTLLSIILDLVEPTLGTITIDNELVKGGFTWKTFTGAYLDENFLPGFLNPREYFEFVASLKGISKAGLEEFYKEFEEFFNGEILDTKNYIRALSKGNCKKVGIAGAFLGGNKLILLDEPFANLDPSTQHRLRGLVKKYHDLGTTFIISSHDLDQVTEISSRLILIDKGEVVKDLSKNEGTLKELEAYFRGEAHTV